MNHRMNLARGALAAALCFAAATALAQPLALYTLISPPLPWGDIHVCTITNVSNKTLQVERAEIVEQGAVYHDGGPSCRGSLAAGKHCILQTPTGSGTSKQPYCRVQYTGTQGALVGSFYGNFDGHVGASPGAAAAVALQPLKPMLLEAAD